jgi:hypothetical protein
MDCAWVFIENNNSAYGAEAFGRAVLKKLRPKSERVAYSPLKS